MRLVSLGRQRIADLALGAWVLIVSVSFFRQFWDAALSFVGPFAGRR